jgi:hypothetical protein
MNPSESNDIAPGAMNFSEQIERLLALPSDFELCSGVDTLIDKRFELDRIDLSVPDPARTVSLIFYSRGVIGNGGFQYLFESGANGDSDFAVLTIDGYRRIGLTEAYAAFAEALRLFPGGLPPTDVEERIAALSALPEDAFDEIDIRYYRAVGDGKLEASLARFIRENKEELAQVLEAGRKNS